MRTITFASIKGGVGKTTMSVHTAAGLADLGHRTLLIDLDPQGHASTMAGFEIGPDDACAADGFGQTPRVPFSRVVQETSRKNLWVAPAGPRMAGLERELFRWGHRLQAVTRAVQELRLDLDAVVVDTPPQLNAFTEAALAAGDLVVVPVPAMAHALQGFDEIHAAWADASDGRGASMIGAINMWDRRTTATNSAMEDAFKELPVKLTRTRIPRNEALNQAGLGYELVYEFSRQSAAVGSFRDLVKELWRLAGKPSARPGRKS
ncbi:MAG: ParA family protein [Pseudomonadota bacterium]